MEVLVGCIDVVNKLRQLAYSHEKNIRGIETLAQDVKLIGDILEPLRNNMILLDEHVVDLARSIEATLKEIKSDLLYYEGQTRVMRVALSFWLRDNMLGWRQMLSDYVTRLNLLGINKEYLVTVEKDLTTEQVEARDVFLKRLEVKSWTVGDVHTDHFDGGGYSRVYRANYFLQGKKLPVALKVFTPSGSNDRPQDRSAKVFEDENEVLMMNSLSTHSDYILKAYGYYMDGSQVTMITELAPFGALFPNVLNQLALKDHISDTLYLAWFHDIACALEFIHYRNVVHRDVKGSNVMVFDNLYLKLGDFGCAKEKAITRKTLKIPTKTYDMRASGTVGFIAPEAEQDVESKIKASDIFSFGKLVIQILTGENPRVKDSSEQMRAALTNLKIPGERFRKKIEKVFLECVEERHERRPTAAKLKKKIKEVLDFCGGDPRTNDPVYMQDVLSIVKDLDGHARPFTCGYKRKEYPEIFIPLNLMLNDPDACSAGVEQSFENCASSCNSCCSCCGSGIGSSLEFCGSCLGGCESGKNICVNSISSGCAVCCSDTSNGCSICAEDIGVSGFACYGIFGTIAAWLLGSSCGAVSTPCCPSYAALSSQAAQCCSSSSISSCANCTAGVANSPSNFSSMLIKSGDKVVVGAGALGIVGAEYCCGVLSSSFNVLYGFRIAVKRLRISGVHFSDTLRNDLFIEVFDGDDLIYTSSTEENTGSSAEWSTHLHAWNTNSLRIKVWDENKNKRNFLIGVSDPLVLSRVPYSCSDEVPLIVRDAIGQSVADVTVKVSVRSFGSDCCECLDDVFCHSDIVPHVEALKSDSMVTRIGAAKALFELLSDTDSDLKRSSLLWAEGLSALLELAEHTSSPVGKYYAAGTLFLVTANAEAENAVVAAILKAGGISVLMELLLNGDREKVLVDRFDVRCQAALVLVNLVTESVETRAQVRGTYLSDVRMVMEATPNTSAARGPVEELYADLVATPAEIDIGDDCCCSVSPTCCSSDTTLQLVDGVSQGDEASVRKLWNMCQNHDDVKLKVGRNGGVPALLKLIKSSTLHCQEQAMGLLGALAINAENKTRIAKEGGIEIIVEKLMPRKQDTRVYGVVIEHMDHLRTLTVQALGNLALHNVANENRIFEAGGLGALIQILKSSKELHMRREAAFALCNFVSVDDYMKIFSENYVRPQFEILLHEISRFHEFNPRMHKSGVLPHSVDLIIRFLVMLDVYELRTFRNVPVACESLKALSKHFGSKSKFMMSNEVVKALVGILRGRNPKFRNWALITLHKFCMHDKRHSLPILAMNGVLEASMEILQEGSFQGPDYWCAKLLWWLSFDPHMRQVMQESLLVDLEKAHKEAPRFHFSPPSTSMNPSSIFSTYSTKSELGNLLVRLKNHTVVLKAANSPPTTTSIKTDMSTRYGCRRRSYRPGSVFTF